MNERNAGTAGKTDEAFVITRVLDAPRETVWKAWTEVERLKRWWGPKGFTVRVAKLDLRPGGIFHYCLRAPDGSDMWGKFVFREIAASERLVFVDSFSDEKGNVTRHPMSPDWPRETLSTVTFAQHGSGTAVTVEWLPLNATEVERKTFAAGHDSMNKGWGGTFEQLADYLTKA